MRTNITVIVILALAATAVGQVPTKKLPPLPIGLRKGESREWNNQFEIDSLMKSGKHKEIVFDNTPSLSFQHLAIDSFGTAPGCEFDQIVSETEAYVINKKTGVKIKVVEFDTRRYADESRFPSSVMLQVFDTEIYETVAGGSKKVFVARPGGEPPKPTHSLPPKPLPYKRVWTNAVHGSKLTGAFYSSDGERVTIMKPDYTKITVDLKILSEADQRHVRMLIAQKRSVDNFRRKIGEPEFGNKGTSDMLWPEDLAAMGIELPGP
jgi:hypothetical protein